jgi:hypothetical protein
MTKLVIFSIQTCEFLNMDHKLPIGLADKQQRQTSLKKSQSDVKYYHLKDDNSMNLSSFLFSHSVSIFYKFK